MSSAETVNGVMADAVSTAGGGTGQAQSTAKTSLKGVSVQSTVMAPASSPYFYGPTTTEALVQSGSAPAPGPNTAGTYAISTVLTDKAYTATLTDMYGASNVAEALLGSQDEILGTAYQFNGSGGTLSTTFDFSFQGDLLLGVIYGFNFDIIINGAPAFATDGAITDTVINLGSNFGPNIDLTIDGEGGFAFGGAVPEPSTWTMMLLGFAGLGFVGYRSTGGGRAARLER